MQFTIKKQKNSQVFTMTVNACEFLIFYIRFRVAKTH